jgi:hypothetical protein
MQVEHQYDCKGNHRIAMTTHTGTKLYGEPSSYDHTAFLHDAVHSKWYMAVTPYYEGAVPHEMTEGVFELTKVGEDVKSARAYNFYDEEQACPWLNKPDDSDVCVLGRCPQKERIS